MQIETMSKKYDHPKQKSKKSCKHENKQRNPSVMMMMMMIIIIIIIMSTRTDVRCWTAGSVAM
jgi:predicted nucleic acid-binding Zn ribbon protein